MNENKGNNEFHGKLPVKPERRRSWLQWVMIGVATLFMMLFLVLPLGVIFTAALEKGIAMYLKAITDPETMAAIRLTLLATLVAVGLNVIFGVATAWLVTKYEFRGKRLLLTLIELPFAISPVIVGLMFVGLLGAKGWFGGWLAAHQIKLIFAVPGIVLVTVFVTFPLVAQELIPVMQHLGNDEEEAALMLGAGGWQTFFRITLPNLKWGLVYGMILCNARAMGEFGAVSVVSGHIRGQTNTIPLQVEILYNDYQYAAAFAVASLLTLLALLTLVVKNLTQRKDSPVHS